MKKFEKYYKDGKVAVLYSPGYGSGWYTWNGDEGLLFDKEIVEAVLAQNYWYAAELAEAKYDAAVKGADNLVVAWLEPGTLFRISEEDGRETLVTYTNELYIKA